MRRVASQELDELSVRVDAWRRQQDKRTQIPEELWEAAARVSKIDGVWATSRATRFNYEKLQERATRARRGRRASSSKALTVVSRTGVRASGSARVAPAFVELPAGSMGVGAGVL